MGVQIDAPPPAGTRRYAAATDLRANDLVAYADDAGRQRWLTVTDVTPVDHGIGWIVTFAEDAVTIRMGHTTRLDIIRPEDS